MNIFWKEKKTHFLKQNQMQTNNQNFKIYCPKLGKTLIE